ncbi:putative U3 small nucleolar RNA-associated protein 10 [Triangularia verruculosa]|uniref:U3 small nucleolar RNA-associated protein 10 n=1 Tax=Triangularia verruculosa TaxID=2587418 RepID=A0AAN6XDK7_9PEZI|nr:putative U3 small nucleolar RNA-associated protein 10 [Triangularia verruculosa]
MSSLQEQLKAVQANTRAILQGKLAKAAHAKSLIFEPQVAAGQTYAEIYTACRPGFDELCTIDNRFSPFRAHLFSEQSQQADRTQMTAEENAVLDKRVESFLHLAGARLQLMPAVKAIEWLVRRFRIHEFNTRTLITCFLPFHTIPVFVTLLSILPTNLPHEYRFLDPYIRSLTNPPIQVLVTQATNHREFLSTLSEYMLELGDKGHDYHAINMLWFSVMTQSVNTMIDKGRSGNRAIQLENTQKLLLQVTPTLGRAMMMRQSSEIQMSSYMPVLVLARKGRLNDAALVAFMDQLVTGWQTKTVPQGMLTLACLAYGRAAKPVSSRVAKAFLKVDDLVAKFKEVNKTQCVRKLANGTALAFVDRLSKRGNLRALHEVKAIIESKLLDQMQVKVIYKSLLLAAHKINDEIDPAGNIRKELASTLVSLAQLKDKNGDAIRAAIEEVDFNIEELELKLGAAIRPKLTIGEGSDDAMEGVEAAAIEERPSLDSTLQQFEKLKPSATSCLSQENGLFNDLCSVFLSAAIEQADLDRFDAAPVLSREQALSNAFYFSFYMRVWCGPYPSLAKVAALERVKNRVKDSESAVADLQAVAIYAAVALADPSKKVRRAAADLIAVLKANFKDTKTVWGSKDLYGANGLSHTLDSAASKCLLESVLLPSLEEAVTHEDQVAIIISSALENSKTGDKKARLAILKSFCAHITETPLLTVKLRLLGVVNQIRSISGTYRTDLLLDMLRSWAAITTTEATERVTLESLDETALDRAAVETAVPSHADGLELLFQLVKDPETRPTLVAAIFERIAKMWPSMKSQAKLSTANVMLELSQSPGHDAAAVEAADLLRKVDLTTDILLAFVDSLQYEDRMASEAPTNKRRRTSTATLAVNTNGISPELDKAIKKMNFVLELVQGSKPENHPELLPSLFTTLTDIHHLRKLVGSELGYMQTLVLSSIDAMIPAYDNNKDLTIDASAGYGDVLAACVQNTSSTQVTNEALLVVASLARTAPDVVLQSVMPIFTFMGSSVLRQADNYSQSVVKKTVQQVIPPLISTFRSKGRNLVASTKDLLASFVTAYEHIPPTRKREIFISLVENLGPDDFLFAVLAMFVDRYGATDEMFSFTSYIMSRFSVEIQLHSLIKFLDLVNDIFKPKPALSTSLIGTGSDVDKTALKQLALLPHLLSNNRLKQEITALAERDDMESVKIRDSYAKLLEGILALASSLKTKKVLYGRCGDALAKLLNLLSISEFIKSVDSLLERPDVGLRRKVLQALELRVDKESTSDPKSREALLAFLPQLTAVIRESDDMNYKHTAVTCVDKISEKYGKKDLDAVAAAAQTIAGDHCLGQSSQSLRLMALLCLASLVDVLQDGIVPVLPVAIPKALGYLEESLVGDKPNTELHNASYAFMAALAQHIPYMISGASLDRLLACSNASAAAELDQESARNRSHCLQLLAKLVDAKVLYTALNNNWATAANAGYSAITEFLEILGLALDKHSRTVVAKHTNILSEIFTKTLDLRRMVATGEIKAELSVAQLEKIDSLIIQTALKMIYKLHDAIFRPVFSKLIEWGWSGLPKSDASGRTLRLVSLYTFLDAFFEALKSIITNYASYIVDSASSILSGTNFADANEKLLWQRVVCTLTTCFKHDQDGFWQAPSHYNAVAPVLIEQFLHAAHFDATEELIPAVVELAAAVDSQEHRKELNTSLLKHLESSVVAVRLAVIKVQQGLTERLEEEWLRGLAEMLPRISELQDDEDEGVERENARWIVGIEEKLGESLDSMLQ